MRREERRHVESDSEARHGAGKLPRQRAFSFRALTPNRSLVGRRARRKHASARYVLRVPDSSKPAVAFLIDRWDPSRGGGEKALAQFALHLIARGHRVLAVAEEHADGAPGEPVEISSFGVTRARREKDRARRLVATARRNGADLLVGCRHLYECDLYWPHGGSHLATLRQLAKMRGEDPDAPPAGRHKAFVEFERVLCESGGARRIVCVAPLVREEFAIAWPSCVERLVTVPNGVDLARFRLGERATSGAALRRQLGIDARTPVIAFAARNFDLKGGRESIAALRRLEKRDNAPWKFVCAGTAMATRTLDRTRAHELEWTDPVALWAAADIALLPTWRDSFGLGVVESLACGAFPITTSFAGAASLVSTSCIDVVSAPSDKLGLDRALDARLERLRRGAIDRSMLAAEAAQFDLATMNAKLERVLAELAP